jgi:putative SOS response-associated peptidase YedK
MCGRYTLAKKRETIAAALGFDPGEVRPRYNIAPSQAVMVVPNKAKRAAEYMRWGLIPSWAKDTKIGYSLINARADTLATKPSFRAALKRRRCLIVADGFYEWQMQADGKTKVPYFIHLKDDPVFTFAGLWEQWTAPTGEEIESCTIITTEPNAMMKKYHDRMPVILPRSSFDKWLDPAERKGEDFADILVPYPAKEMTAYAVTRIVNSPKNNSADCIKPA